MNLLKGFIAPKMPTVFCDPFNKGGLESISIRAYRLNLSGKSEWRFNGSVGFETNQTKGEQNFKGDSLDDVAKKIEAFLSELK